MTKDFFLGQLRLIAVAVVAYFTGTGKLSVADGTLIGAIGAPILLLFGPWLWSIYHNINMKLVPQDSVAIAKTDIVENSAVKGQYVTPQTVQGFVKVVGALLIALALSTFVLADARAASLDPLASLKTFAVDDIKSALDDATANNDTAAVQCWSALLPVVQSQQALTLKKFGVFTALQKARDAVRNVDMLRAGIGPIGDLKNKCAAIIVDTNTFLLRLGIVGAGAMLPF